jgi:hypothetical protein
MSIFDSLIRNNNNWGRLKLTHYKVTAVGYNDREEPTFEDSTVVSSTFFAQEGEDPDYNTDVKWKEEGVINREFKVFEVPTNIEFNEFKNEGVRDRITIQGYGDAEYEVFSGDTDVFWSKTSKKIFLQPLV